MVVVSGRPIWESLRGRVLSLYRSHMFFFFFLPEVENTPVTWWILLNFVDFCGLKAETKLFPPVTLKEFTEQGAAFRWIHNKELLTLFLYL